MKIARISLTGADDNTNPADLLEISREYPIVEWAILLSSKREGTTRYPSGRFLQDLKKIQNGNKPFEKNMNLAAHLCGQTMRNFMTGITFKNHDDGEWLTPHSLTLPEYNALFQRTQVNFNAQHENFTKQDIHDMIQGWYEEMDGALITQHNHNNPDVWEWAQSYHDQALQPFNPMQILHDASGGNSKYQQLWNTPITGIPNGYAGGLGPDNIIDTLIANEDRIGNGVIWIDMEGSLRDKNDTFSLDKCEAILKSVTETGNQRNWFL